MASSKMNPTIKRPTTNGSMWLLVRKPLMGASHVTALSKRSAIRGSR